MEDEYDRPGFMTTNGIAGRETVRPEGSQATKREPSTPTS